MNARNQIIKGRIKGIFSGPINMISNNLKIKTSMHRLKASDKMQLIAELINLK